MDIVGACLLDGFPTDNKLSLKTSKSAAKGARGYTGCPISTRYFFSTWADELPRRSSGIFIMQRSPKKWAWALGVWWRPLIYVHGARSCLPVYNLSQAPHAPGR